MATKALKSNVVFNDPPFAASLFSSPTWSWVWLIVRIYVGWQWLEAGLEKLSNPAWTVTGLALKGFWAKAVAVPAAPAKAAITYEWYRSFLSMMLNANAYTWFSKLIVFGELAIGIGLILGLFAGIAAFFGGFMNWNFMMAGSASTNPMLFVAAVGIILAWKISGYYGADFVLLRFLGTPWRAKKGSAEAYGTVPATSPASTD